MGISVHAYALRLHLVFRLLCAQIHLHLQEMQWHFDSFLRRCVKVTSTSINWKMGLVEGSNVQIGYMRSKIRDKSAAGEATEEMVYDKLIRAMKMDSLSCSGRKICTFYPKTLKSCSSACDHVDIEWTPVDCLNSCFKQCEYRVDLLLGM